MMRWILLIIGIASTTLGIVGYLMHPPIDVAPQELSLTQAVNIIAETDLVGVTLNTGADTNYRVYSALSHTPSFTMKPTTTTYDLLDPQVSAELGSFLGNSVTISTAQAGLEIATQIVRDGSDDQDQVSGERVLAPLEGSGNHLWVLSPFFSGNDPERNIWKARGRYEGILTRLRDIETNVTSFSLDFDYDEIKATAASDIGLDIDDRSLVIIPNQDTPVSGLYRLPVTGASGELWVSPFYEGQDLPAWVATGPIRGLLYVWERDTPSDLAEITKMNIPERYGIIYHDETPEEHNAKTTFGLKLFTGLGAFLLILAGIGFYRRR